MELAKATSSITTILLVEEDVILRLGLSEYLRACGYKVIEAVSQSEAKLVLQKGPHIDIMLLDARLAGDGGGFKLSQWVRKNRPNISVMLTGGLASKTEAAAKLCETKDTLPYSIDDLKARIEGMRARQTKFEPSRKPGRKPSSPPRGPRAQAR